MVWYTLLGLGLRSLPTKQKRHDDVHELLVSFVNHPSESSKRTTTFLSAQIKLNLECTGHTVGIRLVLIPRHELSVQ